jgi:hypothetical protein
VADGGVHQHIKGLGGGLVHFEGPVLVVCERVQDQIGWPGEALRGGLMERLLVVQFGEFGQRRESRKSGSRLPLRDRTWRWSRRPTSRTGGRHLDFNGRGGRRGRFRV